MKPLLDANQAMKDTAEAYNAVRRAYRTEQYQDVINWFDALIAQTQTGMLSCAPAKLVDTQVRIKQLIALRAALADPGGATTGYTFD